MITGILALGSSLHDQSVLESLKNSFFEKLNNFVPARFITEKESGEVDFIVVLVLSGGCEKKFVEKWPMLKSSGKKFVLTAGKTGNSLPASLEILAWLREQGETPEIIHGDFEQVAEKVAEEIKSALLRHSLKKQKIGMIGAPSDWLISSMPSIESIEKIFGLEILNISIEEFRHECDKPDSAAYSEFSATFYQFAGKTQTSELSRAARIYTGFSRCVKKYNLSALTIRCFDILETDKTTGCLAVALMNDKGVPVSCEGDIPALISMIIVRLVTGQTAFMANPSSINDGLVTFAHCTCPVSMLRNISLPTHYESGIGLAVSGNFASEEFTVFKVDSGKKNFSIQTGTVQPHHFSSKLCRTQIVLELAGAEDYFLKRSLSNHHILVAGNHKKSLTNFCQTLGFSNIW